MILLCLSIGPLTHQHTHTHTHTHTHVQLEKGGYAPGKADTEFARRFGHLVGKPVKTVGEAFAEFTAELGFSVNALYKNYITDIVATTHLIAVNARFERDPIWSLGIITTLELMLKNYPEQEIADKIVTALFKAIEMDEETVRSEAAAMLEWAEGKSLADLEAAMSGEGDSEVAKTAIKAKVRSLVSTAWHRPRLVHAVIFCSGLFIEIDGVSFSL